MESLPSFSENSMPALDFLTKLSQIMAPSLLQTSQKNSVASLDTKSPCPQHTTLKLMEKQREPYPFILAFLPWLLPKKKDFFSMVYYQNVAKH